jgi:hypothetical protein
MPASSLGGVTYEQFLQSLGSYNYGIEFFYVSSTSYKQIGQPVTYNHFDASGNSVTTTLPFTVDPYQSNPAMFYETEPNQIIATRLSSLTMTILANTRVFFKFFATITYIGSELDALGQNNMQDLEQSFGLSFFDDYCNYLIDNQ